MRGILQGLAAGDVEKVFRLHAQILNESAACQGMRVVAFDGKTLRGSFDIFADTRAAHLVSAFAADTALVLGHLEIDDKSNACSANSGWPRAWSPWMHCIVKKNLRTRR